MIQRTRKILLKQPHWDLLSIALAVDLAVEGIPTIKRVSNSEPPKGCHPHWEGVCRLEHE